MTSPRPRLATITPSSPPRGSNRPGWRWTPLAVLALALLAVAGAVGIGLAYASTAAREQGLADTATQACAGGAVAPSPDGIALCDQAAQVQAAPLAGPVGTSGRGILGTSIVGGRLIVAYTDGDRSDVGAVTGPPGARGAGISATTIEGGSLFVAYTDGTRTDVGTVTGPTGEVGGLGAAGRAGRGVASVDSRDGRLIVTYTDSAEVDAGPLPRGLPGSEGRQGEQGIQGEPAPAVRTVSRTYSDGTREQCVRTGGPPTDPEFSCERTPPPVTVPAPLPPLTGG